MMPRVTIHVMAQPQNRLKPVVLKKPPAHRSIADDYDLLPYDLCGVRAFDSKRVTSEKSLFPGYEKKLLSNGSFGALCGVMSFALSMK